MEVPLEWRLRPWEAEAHGIQSGTITSLRAVPPPASSPLPQLRPNALARLPNTNPVLFSPGDPRGNHGLQRSLSIERDKIIAHHSPLPTPQRTPASNRGQPRSPLSGKTTSPTPTKFKHAKTFSATGWSPADRKAKMRQFLGLNPKEELYSEYDFHRIQTYSTGLPPRQFHKPDVAEPEEGPEGLTAFRLFMMEFRNMWNQDHPELSDSLLLQREKGKEGLPMVSDHILLERRAVIEKACTGAWGSLAHDKKMRYEERAAEISAPTPLTIEEQLAQANHSWDDMNRAREWFRDHAENHIEELKTKLANLDGDMHEMINESQNLGSHMSDEYLPSHLRCRTAPDPTAEEKLAQEEAQAASEINTVLRSVSLPDSEDKRKASQSHVIWGGGEIQGGPHVEMRTRSRKKARRSSLDLSDRSWHFKSQTSLGNERIKVRRSSIDTPSPESVKKHEDRKDSKEPKKNPVPFK